MAFAASSSVAVLLVICFLVTNVRAAAEITKAGRPAWCDDLKEESLSNRWLAQSGSTAVFVDEVQWDTQIPGGSGTDTGEAFEIFGPAGTDLSGWTAYVYGGANLTPNLVYKFPVGTTIPNLGSSGTMNYGAITIEVNSNTLTNTQSYICLVGNSGEVKDLLYFSSSATAPSSTPFVLAGSSCNGFTAFTVGQTTQTAPGTSYQRTSPTTWVTGAQQNTFGSAYQPSTVNFPNQPTVIQGALPAGGAGTLATSGATGTQYLGTAGMDPHFELSEGFAFDFQGEADKTFCLTTDVDLALTAHFVGGEPSPCTDEVGTWMDALAVLYRNAAGNVQTVVASIDQSKDWFKEDTWTMAVNGEAIFLPSGAKTVSWTSKDGLVTLTRIPGRKDFLEIAVKDLVDLELTTETENRIAQNPDGKYLNFAVKSLKITQDMHGVLGQMFVPGAMDERRTRASPEEYVNGDMEDYLTSSLVASDCAFSKFMTTSALGGSTSRKFLGLASPDSEYATFSCVHRTNGAWNCQ